MFSKHSKNIKRAFGSAIEHGIAHKKDHKRWNRRQFMSMGGLAAVGSLLLRSTPVNALASNSLSAMMNNSDSDNILVLVRLFGGNDGLNTFIPHTEDVGRAEYEGFRPLVKMMHNTHYTDNQILTGYNHTLGTNSNGQFAMPTQMDALMNLWSNDKMSVIHNVGYPNANGSHFMSSNFWSSGTNDSSNDLYKSGWMGRTLDYDFPCFSIKPPSEPPAILLGNTSSLTFNNQGGSNMALTFTDVQEFNDLIANGDPFSNAAIPNTCASNIERRYLRQVANNGFTYNNSIQAAYSAGTNISYSSYSELANKLSIVAKLIKGGLGTRIYMVTLDGFDTHDNQMNRHHVLLQELSDAVNNFYNDLAETGHSQKTLIMSYSEFGRTIDDNNSGGTDHGTLGPVMFFGDAVSGGFHGTPMDLTDPNLQWTQNVTFESPHQSAIDFRGVYATVLQDWLCLHPETINCMFAGTAFERIPNLIENPCTAAASTFENAATIGYNIHPENANIIQIKYALKQRCNIKLSILTPAGGNVLTLVNETKERDVYTYDFNWQNDQIPPGEYICRLQYGSEAGNTLKERKLILQ